MDVQDLQDLQDLLSDLALLSIVASPCPPIEPGDEERIANGDQVYAIGSPVGLGHTVTSGVYSGFREAGAIRLIQTDAAINPGSSGGPLLDRNGRVIGVNTLKGLNTERIGFAIPFSDARRLLALP